jgi:3-hydroxyisobutyrate dehydrogenase
MLEESFDPTFTVAGGAKDAGLALDAVGGMGLEPDDLALITAAREHLDRAVAEGHGDLDIAATYLSHRTP